MVTIEVLDELDVMTLPMWELILFVVGLRTLSME